MSNHSIIEHRANYHYVKLEEDYLAICSSGECSPHCKSLILAVLESWTNTKREKGEGDYIYLTMPQWIKYTYMLYERNIITDCIKELLADGFIARRQIIMFDQKTFEYKLIDEVINDRIKELPSKELKDVFPRLDAYLTYREAAKARAKAKREEKKEEDEVSEKSRTVGDNSPAHNLSKEVSEKSRTVGELSHRVGDNSLGGYVINQRNLESITNLPLTSTNNDMSNDISGTHVENSDENLKDELKPDQPEETQPASYSPSEATNKRPRKPRTTKPKVSLTDTTPIPLPGKPLEDQLWTPLTCMQLADYYRGFVLEESTRKGSKYQKSVDAAIKLVNLQHKTYQEIDRVFRFMKCLDKNEPDGLWDEWWDGKDVDLWNVGDHCISKLTEIERKRKEKAQLSKPNQPSSSLQQSSTSANVRPLLPVGQQQTNSNIIKGSGSITDLRQLSQRAAAMRGAN